MNAPAHTPGPWTVNIGGCGSNIVLNNTSLPPIPITYEWDSREEGQANARLIAAAPDLLAACQLALGQLEDYKPLSGVHASSLRADIDIIRAAIASATGQSR